jgi:formylmethanofuran dehydrogenase subunit E
MIASLHEEAQLAQGRVLCVRISFWERILAVKSKIVCGKCGEAFWKPFQRRTNGKI